MVKRRRVNAGRARCPEFAIELSTEAAVLDYPVYATPDLDTTVREPTQKLGPVPDPDGLLDERAGRTKGCPETKQPRYWIRERRLRD